MRRDEGAWVRHLQLQCSPGQHRTQETRRVVIGTMNQGTTNEIDQRERVGRNLIAAPRDMLIGSRQHELVPVDGRGIFGGDNVEQDHRHTPRAGSGKQRSGIDYRVEPQQRVVGPHDIVERPAVVEPQVRRAAAGHRRRRERRHRVGWVRLAVVGTIPGVGPEFRYDVGSPMLDERTQQVH